MSIIARHKRPGGFRKLVNMLEVTPPMRRGRILDSFREEDAGFVEELEACLFAFEEFKKINGMIITDIIYEMRSNMRMVALALYGCKDVALLDKFSKNMLPAQAAAFRAETKDLSEMGNVIEGQQRGARYRIIEAARKLEHDGLFVLKKYSPRYPDDD